VTTVAQLTIEMAANVARLRSDMDAAKSTVSGAMSSIKGYAEGAAKALAGIGIGLSVVGAGKFLYGLAEDAMRAQAGLQQLSEITGATVEGLSQIRAAAKLSNTEIDAISGGMTKLAKNVETGGASTEKALNAIGLSVNELQGLSTDEMFKRISTAMAGYADGAGKTAAAQLIFGKTGAQLLPVMKDLAEMGEALVTVTAEQTQQADNLEKNIKRLTAAKQAWKKIVGSELVPVLDDVVTVLLKMQTETNGTLDAAKKAAADGSIQSWAQTAVIGVGHLIDTLHALWGVFVSVYAGFSGFATSAMSVFSGIADASVAVIKGNYSQVPGIIKGALEKVAETTYATQQKIASAFAYDRLADRFSAQFAASAEKIEGSSKKARPQIEGLGDAAATATDQLAGLLKALAALTQKNIQIAFDINEDAAKAKLAELEDALKKFGGTDLANAITSSQLASLDAFEANAKAKYLQLTTDLAAISKKIGPIDDPLNVSDDKKKLLQAYISEYEKLGPIARELAGVEDKRNALLRAGVDRIEQQFKAIEDGNKATVRGLEDYANNIDEAKRARELELALIGKTQQQQDVLNARAKEEAEIRKLTIELDRLQRDSLESMTAEQRKSNALAQDAIAIKLGLVQAERDGIEAVIASKKAATDLNEAWKGIEASANSFFSNLFEHGRSAFGNLWSVVKKFFADLAAQLTTKYILNIGLGVETGTANVGGSLLSSLFGGSSGGGAGGGLLNSLLGSGGGLSSMFAGLQNSIIGGFTSLFGSAGTAFSANMLSPLGAIGNALTGFAEGGLGGAISALGGFAGALGAAVPIVGGVIAVLSALGVFDRKPGFKIDNSVVGVGNPASHFTQSALGAFDISTPVDQSKFDALRKAIQTIDTQVAGLLGPDTLATVKQNIQNLQNATHWENLDATGIETATKAALQQRYGTAFDSINAKVAATIRGFAGTADQLMKFVSDFVQMRAVVDAATTAASKFGSTMSHDVQAALDQQSNSVLYAWKAQQSGLHALLDVAPDATNALGLLVSGMAGFQSAAVQMELQLQQVKAAMGGMFDDSIRTLQMSVLDPSGQYAFLQNEADQLAASALKSNDPLQIQQMLQRILGDVSQAQSLLTPEQRAASVPEQISRLQQLRGDLEDRIAQLSADNKQAYADGQAALLAKLTEVADAQMSAATKQSAAADTNLIAAQTPRQENVTVTVDLLNGTARGEVTSN
jgi:hypothetical protein